MSRFDIHSQGLINQSSEIRAVAADIGRQKNAVMGVREQLIGVSGMGDVAAALNITLRNMDRVSTCTGEYADVLSEIMQSYETTEEKIIGHGNINWDSQNKSHWQRMIEKDSARDYWITEPVPAPQPKLEWNQSISEIFENFSNDIKDEEDERSLIKTILGGADSIGQNDESGILKDIITYIESFTKFFTGDKRGFTGASDWCNLADSSIGMWSKLYDYYCNMYKGLKTGFFGEAAQKNVKKLGLTASFFALISSVLSASDGLDKKAWQNMVADYLDCGKDVVSVIQSGYVLKHIGDVKSLANEKGGLWNALSVYAAIANSGIRSASQGFRSYEKYSADGNWDLGDTGATGIDISMAGIYGLSHSLTFGLDDLIFGVIDSVTGGDGNSEMSYFEKAAEGWKIVADRAGEALGNWWRNLGK